MLVGRFGVSERLGLVLTNLHNVGLEPRKLHVRFAAAPGQHERARVLGTIAADWTQLDYSLLLVRLPKAMRAVRPVEIGRGGDVDQVYVVGYRRGRKPALVVSAGRHLGTRAIAIDPPQRITSHIFGYAAGRRMSGSGVYSARTGALQALHWGDRTLLWRSVEGHAVPIERIRADIAATVPGIQNEKIKAAVLKMLRPADSADRQQP